MDDSEIWPSIRATYTAGDLSRCEALLAGLPQTETVRLWEIRIAGRRGDAKLTHACASSYLDTFRPNVEVVQALARAANKLKDARGAATAWRKLVELTPDSAEALRQSARANGRVGNDAVAIAAAARLARLAESNPEIVFVAAPILLGLDQVETLANMAEAILRIDPAKIEMLLEQLAAADEWRGLAATIAGAQRAAPQTRCPIDAADLTDRLLSRAVRRERDGSLIDALNDFRAVVVLYPDESLAHRGFNRLRAALVDQARALVRLSAHGEAIDAFRMLYRTDPASPTNLLMYGRTLMNADQLEQAADVWRAAIEIDPDFEEPTIQLARIVEKLDQPFEALAAWDAVLARWPNNEEAGKRRTRLGNTLLKRGRNAVAEGDLLTASRYLLAVPKDASEYADARERLGRVGRLIVKDMRAAYKVRDYAAIVAIGSVGDEVAPDNFELHRLLAKGAAKLRNPELAISAWSRVVAIQDNAEARIEIAKQHVVLGDFSDAEKEIAAAIALDPAVRGVAELRESLPINRPLAAARRSRA